MSRVKLKIFGTYSESLSNIVESLQTRVNKWEESNPKYQILDSDITMSEHKVIMIVKYYESIKRDLLLEKEIENQKQ